MQRHIFIEAIKPAVDNGAYPVKRIVGDPLMVTADIFRDGHEHIAAQFRLRDLSETTPRWHIYPMTLGDNDSFKGTAPLARNTEMAFCIDAWTDVFGTWLLELKKKVEAGLRVDSELAEGAEFLRTAQAVIDAVERQFVADALRGLQAIGGDPQQSYALLAGPALRQAMYKWMPRRDLVSSAQYHVTVDRPRALFGTWYEMFVRSAGTEKGQGSTFTQAQARLPHIAAMGFDVLYLAPIHPIGMAHRKGPNNSLTAGPNDPGCPWAIGSAAGGHTAIEPTLGTLADFAAFVAAAKSHHLEIALDFAIQCSPDHPWVKSHPQWFYHRPDGSIKYAENPPKKYQDVYPVNFDTDDKDNLWQALLDVVLFWVGHGVKIFRVDNPHTKPFAFWQWMISAVRRKHPEVIFLAEAFTRPKVMKLLAKVGFTQSYTYFTWRNKAAELREYLEELTQSDMRDYFRPNFFANTPDILPDILVHGGRAAFKMRLILAATLSPTYGIYSGYELCENAVLLGKEEYLDSEKYEIRVRDWQAPGNLNAFIAQINRLRVDHVALQHLSNLTFFTCDNDNLLAYGKRTADSAMIVVVNVDPHNAHHGTVIIPPAFTGATERYDVTDLLDGTTYHWGSRNYVRLVPDTQPAPSLEYSSITLHSAPSAKKTRLKNAMICCPPQFLVSQWVTKDT